MNKVLIAMLFISAFAFTCHAQITGPSPVTQGQSEEYVYLDDAAIYTNYVWDCSHGNVTSHYRSGIYYYVTIQWTTAGTATLAFRVGSVTMSSRSVTVSSCGVVPLTPSGLTVTTGSNLCGAKTISYSGASAPVGRKWYWQTSSTGTSTTNSTTSFSATASGSYYIRARADCSGTWSSGAYGPIAVTVNNPAQPPFPSTTPNSCGARTLSMTGTPPAGVTWYWQGNTANGTLTNTELNASNNTFSATLNGANNYYVRAVDTNGCWGPARSLSVSVDNPAAPNANSFSYCEWDALQLSTNGYTNTMRWYNASNALVATGTTYTPTGLKGGTYTYKVRSLGANGCEGTSSADIVLTVRSNCDEYVNSVASNGYGINTDGSPKLTGATKMYTNGSGDLIQSQIKYLSTNQVIANQPMYGWYNNLTGNTLDAPINSSTFEYRYRFMTNQSPTPVPYGPTDFDNPQTMIAGGVFNAQPVGNDGIGSLGWYYSPSNTLEPQVHSTVLPYTRTYEPPVPDPKESHYGGPSYLALTGSRHTKTEKRLISGELDNYFLMRPQFVSKPASYNPNLFGSLSPESVTGFSIYSWITISAQAGYIIAENTQTGGTPAVSGPNMSVIPGKQYVLRIKGFKDSGGNDPVIYVANPAGTTTYATGPALASGQANEGWVELTFTVPTGVTFVRAGVRWNSPTTTGQRFKMSDFEFKCLTPTVPFGYEFIATDQDGRKSAVFEDAEGVDLASAKIISGTSPSNYVYDFWTYNFYNESRQLVASIAPSGLTSAGTAVSSPATFVTTFKYDHHGRTIEVNTPDNGRTRFVYSSDGKIRFSQDQEQFNANAFSYTNYDHLGRLVESGEYLMSQPGGFFFEVESTSAHSANSVLDIADNFLPQGYHIDTLISSVFIGPSERIDTARCRDHRLYRYDRQPVGFPADADHPRQSNLTGSISKIESAKGTTWFSYDEAGAVQWTIQSIIDLGNKSVDYTYNFSGAVTDVAYQKGKTDKFYHHYIYDDDGRIKEVYTSPDGTTKTLHATYYYYLHGPLKRVELASASCKQGIDYVYTITGDLKSINSNDPAADPGRDGISGSPNAANPKDFFGETLHYSSDDYSGVNYNAGTIAIDSQYPSQYSGRLMGVSYNNTTELNIGANGNARRIHGFNYDNAGRLKTSSWGSVSGNSSTFGEPNRENVDSYDKNGNIISLIRKGKSGSTTANYNYIYEAGTNRVDRITQGGSNVVDYTYNAVGQTDNQVEGSERNWDISYNLYGQVTDIRNVNSSNKVVQRNVYDNNGQLVKRIDCSSNGLPAKTTYYVRDPYGMIMAIYIQIAAGAVQLSEFPIYGANRIGMFQPATSTFLYEVSDHLGNVRSVCALSSRVNTYSATMETETSEEPPFRNVAATRVTYAVANHTPSGGGVTGNEVARLNRDMPAGPAIILQVSPGDKIDMDAWAYYFGNGTSSALGEATMILKIAAAFGGVPNGPGESGQIYSRINGALTGQLGSASSPFPAAFITCIVYDKNYVREFFTSTAVPTGNSGIQQHIVAPTVNIEKPGYAYICLINRSDDINPVYFDDFVVKQTQGAVVAGADYYPFGLPLDGTEIVDEPYRFGYQGQFSEKDPVTSTNTFDLRTYDPRFGRWTTPDPFAQSASPYVGMGNLPNSSVDPNGGFNLGATVVGAGSGFILGSAAGMLRGNSHWWEDGLIGAVGLGVAGALSGDINMGAGQYSALDKFRAEVEMAVVGEGRVVFRGSGSNRRALRFGPGAKTRVRTVRIKWKYADVYKYAWTGAINGLDAKEEWTVEGENKGYSGIVVEDQNGTVLDEFQPEGPTKSENGGFRTGILIDWHQLPPVTLPKGSTGAHIRFSWPTGEFSDGTIRPVGAINHTHFYHTIRDIKSSRQLNKEIIRMNVRSTHTKYTGGLFFRR